MARYMQLGNGWHTFMFISSAPNAFFLYNIKEYYLGEYLLPAFNSISEGSVILFGILSYASYNGWEQVSAPFILNLPICHIFAYLIFFNQTIDNFRMIYEILTADKYEMPFKAKTFFLQFFIYFYFLVL